jgi:capsular exopolysaccharide synthesis family protein
MLQVDQTKTNESTIATIKKYFYLYWAWAWLILLAGALAGATAFFVSSQITPIYQSSTRLLVSNPSSLGFLDTTSLITNNMTTTYAKMLTDGPVLQGVIDQLKLPMTPASLSRSILVTTLPDTQLLVVTVRDTDPVRAADIANMIGTVFSTRVRELLTQRYAASLTGLDKQISDMQQTISTTRTSLDAATDPSTQRQLQDQLTQFQNIYTQLVTSYEQVHLAAAQTGSDVVVSEPATVSTIPVIPRTGLYTFLAVVIGLLLAMGAVTIVDALDDTIKDPDVIRQKFKLPILGVIASHEQEEGQPICLTQPRSRVAEAFRALRTNITYASVDTPLRRILVTSSSPQEGKTTVVANLGVIMAQGEVKVAIVDADLRRPQVHQRFGLQNHVGLSDMFLQQPPSGVIQPIPGVSLGVITSGPLPPNPAELLTSKKMKGLIDLINQQYDRLLIDTPPALNVSDAYALAPGMDGVILVAKPGVTKTREFQQMLEQLQAVKAHVLGVVLNQVSPDDRMYRQYHTSKKYSYYYDYFEGDGKKKKKRKGDENNQGEG